VHDHDELAGANRRFVHEHAVLRNPEAVETGTNRADPADDDGRLQGSNDGGHERTRNEHRAHSRHEEEGGPEQQTPDAAPERTGSAPALHTIASRVIANDVLAGLVVLTYD